ncbi:pre-peptidase C-terminal domain-containing protein [Denitratimonas sp. CY0512]|uniref:pre-peptidase C-terminal domain-containing protein n=1 Tax=Denitratimonas sp. CY0512 TaxID=3131940 RepID=UPI0030AD830E
MALAVALACAAPLAGADEFVASGARLQTSALEADGRYDRFIIKFQDSGNARLSTARRNAAFSLAGSRHNLQVSSLRQLAVGGEVIELDRALDATQAHEFMQDLVEQGGVEYVEVDRLNQIRFVPNDTRYGEMWHYFESVGGLNVQNAWDISTGSGVVVAVLDTGITNHSDLNANVVAGYDFISSTSVAGDGNGRDADPSDPGDFSGGYSSSWHGTHVAGTVAAVGNNNKGIAGVAFGAKIQPVRVLGRGGGYDSDIAEAIVWSSGGNVSGVPANATPAKVINLSLGGSGSCGSTFQNAINSAVSRGSVVVIAAGNDNMNVSNASPANCNNVIAVAANDKEGNRSWYSNYGNLIDVTAPGGETCIPNASLTACQTATTAKGVLSTLNSGSTTPVAETYAFYDGTSMATPHVAGVAALMIAASPTTLTPAQIETTLKNTARPLPGTCSGGCGAGIVDAYAAVSAVAGSGPGNTPPVANFSSTVNGLTVNFTDTSTDADGSIASRSWNFGDGTTSSAANPSKTYASAGSYNVTLTVTDNQGASHSKSATVTVAASGGSVLANGVQVTGISGAASSAQYWTIEVPAGATDLNITMSGGSGDADLYVRRGSAPTTSSYDCRPYRAGNNEGCTFATPTAGTWHVMVRGYSAFSGVSLVGSYSTQAPNTPPVANFSSTVNGLTVNFTDTSTDADGSIASRSWNFGDGTTSSAANPSKTYASAGSYSVTLTVTDNQGASHSKSATVTVAASGGSVLANGVPVSGISGTASDAQYWTIEVPAGATNLNITMSGGSGDADLYVRRGSAPTTSSYDCRPYRAGNNESCTFAAPTAGTWHVMVRGYSSFSGVTLTASYTEPSGGGNVLSNGVPVSGISGTAGSTQFWTIVVPSGRSSLEISMSGGSGDADLYVRRGSAPTTSSYDCRPYRVGNNEVCTFNAPTAGTYHIMVRGYSTFSGVNLVGSHN